MPRVAVVGSLNIDYLASVEKLPVPGQTIAASTLIQRFGGKGANQAVAAARQGAKVWMFGCVGADDNGRAYRKRLKQQGVNISGLCETTRALTGTALIAVDRDGENMIIVAPGANGELIHDVDRVLGQVRPKFDAILLQFEVPMPAILSAISWANQAGVPVILNPSPLRENFPWGKCVIDTLIVNSGEAASIFKLDSVRMELDRQSWAKGLHQTRIKHLIVTRGSKPTLCLNDKQLFQVPTLKVKPVDTVGAGDAFAGTFAARRAAGLDLRSVICLANCAGALATLKQGAQEAIPTRAATQRALRSLL